MPFSLLLSLLFFLLPVPAKTGGRPAELATLRSWRVGAAVSAEAVRAFGEERCFTASALPDSIFRLMQGRTYRKGCPVRRADLRYLRLLHYDGAGRVRLGEMVCHRSVGGALTEVFRGLFHARYPVERMLLADRYGGDDGRSMRANNTSCFNFRPIAGAKRLSKHASGLAVDVNPLYNPHVVRRGGRVRVSPAAAAPYADRAAEFPYKITRGDPCHRLFLRHGFKWGGAWRSSKDYQHFEK